MAEEQRRDPSPMVTCHFARDCDVSRTSPRLVATTMGPGMGLATPSSEVLASETGSPALHPHEDKEKNGMVCVRARTTHHYTHDCGWYKTEESWQPTEHCEDESSHHAGQQGILGQIGGICCECLICGHSRLSENYLRL